MSFLMGVWNLAKLYTICWSSGLIFAASLNATFSHNASDDFELLISIISGIVTAVYWIFFDDFITSLLAEGGSILLIQCIRALLFMVSYIGILRNDRNLCQAFMTFVCGWDPLFPKAIPMLVEFSSKRHIVLVVGFALAFWISGGALGCTILLYAGEDLEMIVAFIMCIVSGVITCSVQTEYENSRRTRRISQLTSLSDIRFTDQTREYSFEMIWFLVFPNCTISALGSEAYMHIARAINHTHDISTKDHHSGLALCYLIASVGTMIHTLIGNQLIPSSKTSRASKTVHEIRLKRLVIWNALAFLGCAIPYFGTYALLWTNGDLHLIWVFLGMACFIAVGGPDVALLYEVSQSKGSYYTV